MVVTTSDAYARVFRRHAHPFSAWSRLLSAPLLLVPLWTRRWGWYLPIGAWFAVNPVIMPPAQDTSSFATRAILGEESWSRDPLSEPRLVLLSGATTGSLVAAMMASHRRSPGGAVAGSALFVTLTLWQWRWWADRFTREHDRPASS